jgi:hypothetical protein
MMTNMNRARWVVVTGLIAVGMLSACDRVKTELLQPQNPGIIDPSATTTPTAALALRTGALVRFNQVVNGNTTESIWAQGGMLTDEFKNADFQVPRADIDQRNMAAGSDGANYGITQQRGFVRDAITAMKNLNPDSLSMIGELYAELGFFEMTLADTYCNGIPLGHTIAGVQTLGVGLPTQQVYDSASAHLDTAILIVTGADAYSIYVRRMAQIFKARVLVMQGKFAAAAALVPVANVPTTYQYDMTFSASGSGTNGLWSLANSIARITVGDSFDIVNGVPNQILNALPFASANDPRLPILTGKASNPVVTAEDQSTPMFLSQLWKGQFDPLVLASGIDARLIEAEAALNNNDIPGMMTILNTLRAAKPSIAAFPVPAMAALPAPATQAAAVALFFRESAFWTFGRGQRLPAMRRMIRLYGLPQTAVFPGGVFFKGGVYGTDVNFPISSTEQANPLWTGCIDRNA